MDQWLTKLTFCINLPTYDTMLSNFVGEELVPHKQKYFDIFHLSNFIAGRKKNSPNLQQNSNSYLLL